LVGNEHYGEEGRGKRRETEGSRSNMRVVPSGVQISAGRSAGSDEASLSHECQPYDTRCG
jgi:hypothetical protein